MAYEFIAQGARPPEVQTPTQAAGQMLQLRALAQEGQMRQLQMQQAQQQMHDDEAARQLFAQNANPTPQEIYSRVGPARGVAIVKSQRELETAHLTQQKTQLELRAKQVEELDRIAAMATPSNYQQLIGEAAHSGRIAPDILGTLPPAYPGPDAVQQFRQKLLPAKEQLAIAHQTLTDKLAQAAAAREAELQPGKVREQTAKATTAEAEATVKSRQADAMKSMKPEDWDIQVDNAIAPSGDTQALNARTKALVRGAMSMGLPLTAVQAVIKDASDQIGRTETGVRTAKATAPIKIQVAGATADARAPHTSSDALDLMAESALAGQMPSSRNPVLYSRVMDRAAQLAKERGLTAQQAVMERNAAVANKTALNAVTKQYETLKPFADMAEKNADILEQKMAKVSDLGAPILNTPLRMLQSRFAGNTNVAALQAALLPVQADFARILNSPTGSGVLSDTARKEMEGAIQPGATVAQMRAALAVFRQDAKNRREAYESQLADLKTRTVAGSTDRTGGGNVQPTHRFNPQTGQIEVVK